jgi:hypothetical protein
MRAVNLLGYFRTKTNLNRPSFFSSANLFVLMLGNKQVDATDTCYFF